VADARSEQLSHESVAADVRLIAERVAAALVERGARAVALVGSRARGDATADSDLDLAVVGEGPRYRLEIHDATLVSLGWASAEEQLRRLDDPEWLATHVPGWRDAVVLLDPEGLANEIKAQALDWDWSGVDTQCDEWVAETITGLAEEVEKLAASVRSGDDQTAAIQRSILVLRLPGVMAIHRRILYRSENRLWDLVADELGAAWRQAQKSALGLEADNHDAGCGSALSLFELAVQEARDLFDERQSAVVDHALRRARHP
jgi:hypothetical protein